MSKQVSSQTNWHDYVESRLSAYIDGQLPEDERIQVRKHLGECSQCQASLDSLGWTIKLVKQLPVPALPRQFTLPVPETSPAPAATGWLRWGLAAASGLAVLVLAVFISIQILKPQGGPFSGLTAMQSPSAATSSAASKSGGNAVPAHAPTNTDQILPVAATMAPAATSAPAAPPVAPAATQPSLEVAPASQSAPSPTIRPPRATRLGPTPTPMCEFGCGGGPGDAPPGMGGGGNPAAAPTGLPSQPGPMVAAGLAPLDSIVVISGTVNTPVLNVRSAPSETAPRIGVLRKNASVDIAGRDDSGKWIEIVFHQTNQPDQPGWIIANSILLSISVYDLPIIMTPPAWTPTPTPAGMSFRPPRPTRTPTLGAPTQSPTTPPVVNVQPTVTPAAPTAAPTVASPHSPPASTTPLNSTKAR
ncbi:MAG: zf-HC2 domain-containing protein [Anaerolineae bacterium]